MRIADVFSSDQKVRGLLPTCYVIAVGGFARGEVIWRRTAQHRSPYREPVRTPPLPVR